MPKPNFIVASIGVALLFGTSASIGAAETAPTQPAPEPPAAAVAATQPAAGGADANVPAPAATQTADQKAAAAPKKQIDPRWRNIFENQRRSSRTAWANAAIAQTFKPGALASLSLSNGLLKADVTDLSTPVPVRVAVEGSKWVWMLARSRVAAFAGPNFANASYVSLSGYDFDAKDDEPWQWRLFLNNRMLTLSAQSLYGSTSLSQANGTITLRVSEFTQFGQPQNILCSDQAPSLIQLRDDHPEDFRAFVLPLLARFGETDFLQVGAADVYSVFTEIPADPTIVQDLEAITPQLDADDPADRDAASAKLRELGEAGVLAALRIDDSNLSEEQRLRLKSFIAAFRHIPAANPTMQRHSLAFLIDCLEYPDPAVRAAAKIELENETHEKIDFDPTLSGSQAERAADALRKQLLSSPVPALPAAPATQPAPQS